MTRLGRTAFPVRQSFIARSIAELKASVKNAGSGVTVPDTTPSIVMMFTGQGSQYAGMGKQLYESSAYFREKLDEKLDILHQLSGKDYRAILFELQHEIHMPEHTQPGLLALEVALAEYLSHCGIRADLMLGHSLGEYSAMVAAKAMSFWDAASLVIVRAQLIQQTAPGVMCSIMAGADMLPSLLHGTEVDIAAINSDTLGVISGSENELSRVMARAQQAGIFCQPLKVKRAFHSRLLEPILPAFREVFQNISFSTTQIPVLSTLTGQIEPFAQISQADYWVRQMREPVAFSVAIKKAAAADKAVCFIEVGPGNTLKTLASQNTHHLCINVLPHPAELEQSDKVLMTAFGRLWEQGINIQWQNIHDRRPVPATPVPPGYPFELTDCWTEPQHTARLTLNSYQPCWVPLTRSERVTESTAEWLLITDDSSATAGMVDMLCGRLTLQGARTRIISFEAEHCHKMMKEAPDHILLLLHPDTFRRETFKPLLILLEMVRNWRGQGARCLRIITRSAVDFLTSPCPALAALTSAVKSLNQEYPALTTRLIDTDGQNETLLAHEVTAQGPVVVALRGAERFGEGFLVAPLTESGSETISPRSVIILGGGGQVGLQYAKVFLENSQAHVRLLQRSSLQSLREQGVKTAMQRADRIEVLMQRWPGRLTLGEADVQSVSSLMTACQKARADMGSLDVLIHTAGIDASMHYQLIRDVDAPFCELSFAAKSQGLHNMAEVASSLEVPHCHVISSISSALGGIGMYIYGALHAWLDAAVAELRRHHPSRWTLLNWEAWEFGNDEEVPEHFRQGAFGSELNRYAMQPAQGRRFLWQCWQDLKGQRIISSVDFQQRYREWVENQHEVAGSIDDTLAQKAPRPDMKSEYQPPQTTAEEKIVTVWESLLGLHGIGIDDNFFELGGHSLLALRMTGQVNQSINATMSMVDIFQYPTVRKLAASITGSRSFDTARADAAQRAQRRRYSQSSKRA
ncbi:acyltransferase domain-containing protein [Xenorhabdus sp. SGI246]|uniref:acyltransferase domain-containing protein n=1 Tax=Xenorhabdus sp. SGI246 TaxID=3158263 RepID=UPI00349F33A6